MFIKKRGLLFIPMTVMLLASMSLTFQGCSSSSPGEGSGSDDEAFLDEGTPTDQTAQTDAVPEDGNELKTADSTTSTPSDTEKKEPEPLDPNKKSDLDELASSTTPAPSTEPTPEPTPEKTETKQEQVAESTMPIESTTAPIANEAGTGTGEQEDYKIQKTDTLMKIAFEVYGDIYRWKDIYEKNKDKIKDPNNLPVGLKLQFEKGASHTAVDRSGERYDIKTGDTLGTIAKDIYGTTAKWKKLWDANKQLIKNPNRIYAGFYLYYSLTPEEKTEAERLKQQGAQPLAVTENTEPTQAVNPVMSEPVARAPASAAPATSSPVNSQQQQINTKGTNPPK